MQNVKLLSQIRQRQLTDDYNSYLAYKRSLGKQLLVSHWGSLHCLWRSRRWMWRHIPGDICSVNLLFFDWLKILNQQHKIRGNTDEKKNPTEIKAALHGHKMATVSLLAVERGRLIARRGQHSGHAMLGTATA